MTYEEASILIARRPSVHRLCYGAFLQSVIWISPEVLAVPLAPLGFAAEQGYVSVYLRQFFGIELNEQEIELGRLQGAEALPVVSLIYFPDFTNSPEDLELSARVSLQRAEQMIAWATGDRLVEFAYVTVIEGDSHYFRMVPPHSRRRQRWGPGNTGDAFQSSIYKIREAADEDPRFAFAMAMFSDAAHEPNELFKVCRLFNVLEALAYALKTDEIGSRRAVKMLLGQNDGTMSQVIVENREIFYDPIEIAGRLRDKFFHGAPFRESDLIEKFRPVFYIIENCPDIIADSLLSHCELALSQWANNVSPGRDAAKLRG